jgi:hypothetical protein
VRTMRAYQIIKRIHGNPNILSIMIEKFVEKYMIKNKRETQE